MNNNMILIIFSTLLLLSCCIKSIESFNNNTLQNELGSERSRIELSLRSLEMKRLKSAHDKMKEQKISLTGFYHTSAWRNYWEYVISEQLLLLDGKRMKSTEYEIFEDNTSNDIIWGHKRFASLLEVSDKLNIITSGDTINDHEKIVKLIKSLNILPSNYEKIMIQYNRTMNRDTYTWHSNDQQKAEYRKKIPDLTIGEVASVDKLHKFCKNEVEHGRKAFVYYFHSKGSCCTRKNKITEKYPPGIITWRESMNTFNLEFPSICMRALLDGYNSCGMEYQDAHYSGNYWWANCDHVAKLIPLPSLYDAYAVEFFIFKMTHNDQLNKKIGFKCGYSTHNFKVNHYDVEKPRDTYLGIVMNYLLDEEIPINPLSPMSAATSLTKKKDDVENCIKLRNMKDKKRYVDIENIERYI